MFTSIINTILRGLKFSQRKREKVASAFDPVVDNDDVFGRIYAECKPYTMTSKTRMYALFKAVQHIIHAEIPGDFVECGVWKGGSTMVIAHTLLSLNITNRKLYLYDTFEGMPDPTDTDRLLSDTTVHASEFVKQKLKENINWCHSPLKEVQQSMLSTGYPEQNLIFVQGKVEETIPGIIPAQIALLRLDTDWYSSTRHELLHLYPLLSMHGVLLLDDYGWWSGSKKAVDEFFEQRPILLNRIDPSGRIGIKIA